MEEEPQQHTNKPFAESHDISDVANAQHKWGDLLLSKQSICIYGSKGLQALDEVSFEYDMLPREFEVWSRLDTTTGLLYPPSCYWHKPKDGIWSNSYVWFDYRPYLDQLLENVTVDNLLVRDGESGLVSNDVPTETSTRPALLYTWFVKKENEGTGESKKHFIVCYPHDRWYNVGWHKEPERERKRFVRLYKEDFKKTFHHGTCTAAYRLTKDGITALECTPQDCNAGYFEEGDLNHTSLLARNVLWFPSWYMGEP